MPLHVPTARPTAKLKTWGALCLLLACLFTWGSVGAPAAHAQHNDDTTEGESRAALVMDASGSMAAEDVGGGTRMEAAKQAAGELVDSLPETAVMGLLAYGARESNAPDNRAAGCRDVEVLNPVERIDKQRFIDEFNDLEPTGYTPIGESLRAAADELGDEGGAVDHPRVRRHRYMRPAAGMRGRRGAGR